MWLVEFFAGCHCLFLSRHSFSNFKIKIIPIQGRKLSPRWRILAHLWMSDQNPGAHERPPRDLIRKEFPN